MGLEYGGLGGGWIEAEYPGEVGAGPTPANLTLHSPEQLHFSSSHLSTEAP